MKDRIAYLIFCALLLVAGVANASLLDVVKDNPDRYVSLDLLATWDHQNGLTNTPAMYGGLVPSDSQSSVQNDRGMRGVLRIPLESDVTLLFGGSYSHGDFSYSPSMNNVLLPQNGSVHGYGFEAGLRFYLKP